MQNILRIRKEIWLILLLLLDFQMLNAQGEDKLERFEFSHTGMGTLFTVIGYAASHDQAEKMAKSAFTLVDSLNLIMSDYNPESELMKLSRKAGNGEWIGVSGSLFDVIDKSLCWSDWTDGIFDITLGVYTQLWRRAGRKDQLPDSMLLKTASSSVGYRYIKLDKKGQSVKLLKSGMQLDLGGIAKGYTVDKIYEMFLKIGIDRLLVDGGGDLRMGLAPPGSNGWRIVMNDQYGEDSVGFLSYVSIATSGDKYRYSEINGVRYSHIIDPRTGYGVTVPRTVTVMAPDCTTADVLASFLSIVGPEKGFGYLTTLDQVGAMIVQSEHGSKMTYYFLRSDNNENRQHQSGKK